jgi:transposase
MALELGAKKWQLGFTIGAAQKARRRKVTARDMRAVEQEVERAKERFGLGASARVVSCYEAGRDGFWLHRCLTAARITNVVVDSASIEVNRRARRAKSDGLDVQALLLLLLRYHDGERKVWSVVRVPTVEQEDRRQLHRELVTLKQERTAQRSRIRGLLATQGLRLSQWKEVARQLERMRLWDGSALPAGLHARLQRELERLEMAERQIRELETEQRRALRCAAPPGSAFEQIQRLERLRGVGVQSAWVLVMEAFSWRQFQNRRQVGGSIGLTPTPYQSSESNHEQGISKAGNVWIRSVAVELAWLWLRWQPQSELSRWYWRRFGAGSGRQRRVGIVALARKLMVALWRYTAAGVVPEGAQLKGSGEIVLKAAAA